MFVNCTAIILNSLHAIHIPFVMWLESFHFIFITFWCFYYGSLDLHIWNQACVGVKGEPKTIEEEKNHIEWFDCKSVWRHFYSVFFVFFSFFAIEVTAHFDGDLSRGKFHISIKITVNLFTNDYGVWTEERASYLWRINARNVQHPTELSFEHADRNASNNSCQLEMWERESEPNIHFIA